MNETKRVPIGRGGDVMSEGELAGAVVRHPAATWVRCEKCRSGQTIRYGARVYCNMCGDPLSAEARAARLDDEIARLRGMLEPLNEQAGENFAAAVHAQAECERLREALREIANWEKPRTVSYYEAYHQLRAAARAALRIAA